MSDDVAYLGQVRTGTDIKHGRGSLLQKFFDGTCVLFQGYWRNGIKEGRGRVISTIGNVYEGEWKNGQCEGKGIYIYGPGDDRLRYEGDFVNNWMNGRGTLYFRDGSKYVGQMENEVRHGYGKMIYNKGVRVVYGMWENDLKVKYH